MKATIFITLLVTTYAVHGQVANEVTYPALGIQFNVPAGWKGQETDGAYLMGSDTEAGLIILMPHEEKSLDRLKEQAKAGLMDEGIQLHVSGPLKPVGAEGIGAEFSGTIQGTPVSAYVAAVINPFGVGVTILCTADKNNYSKRHEQLCIEVATSLRFSQPKESPIRNEWQEVLTGSKLTYMKSSYSSGASYDGYSTYSGYSSREEITLCPSGNFQFYSSSSGSFDSGGGFGSMNDSGNGNGTWSVGSDAAGIPFLVLRFDTGKEVSYRLEYKESKTYLNGYRYFRTYDHGACR